MKKLLVLSAAAIALVSNAQLRMKSYGQLQIGQESSDVSSIPVSRKDSVSRIQIFGPYGEMGEGGRIPFGDAALVDNLNVLIGELGTTDCDKLWLHGKRGTYFTTTSNAGDTIAFFDAEKGRYFQFNCDVKTTGVFVKSDAKFKENIQPLTCADKLSELTAVSYKLKPETAPSQLNSIATQNSISEKDARDNAFFAQYYQNMQNQPTRFGFIAQEVKEIFPELVRTDSIGDMYVDYIGMIPLLVSAVKELKAKSDSLEAIIAEGEYSQLPQRVSTQNSSVSEIDSMECELFQNAPNPFNAETVIRCNVPESIGSAELYVFDLQGALKLKKAIEQRGKTSVAIRANELPTGMYIYSLIADGQERGSKRMILTD